MARAICSCRSRNVCISWIPRQQFPRSILVTISPTAFLKIIEMVKVLPVSELVAGNLGVEIIEVVTTHCAPDSAVFHFQSSLPAISSSQSHCCTPAFMTVTSSLHMNTLNSYIGLPSTIGTSVFKT